ncbi:DUF309 domain-containing protein [Desulfuromonas sp. AOP6]|uniref:DUF309 domain-containing protein n=1 Tax=Desulfuromonas sp. AOP6 TaxID=1566351 RepID=UPI001BD086E6|nr:DUF309 domain-containing protein [Desulfuromonas sp. AOP6]
MGKPIDCDTFPCDALSNGVRQFNEGRYFACHETLEDLWKEEAGSVRDLYKGILQIGIGLLHWQKGNYGGACALLKGGIGYLQPFAPVCRHIDVRSLLQASTLFLQQLQARGVAHMADVPASLVPRIEWLDASG